MIEALAMLTVLAGMGIYLVKSTDLPPELKNRSADLRSEMNQYEAPKKSKFAHLTNPAPKKEVTAIVDTKNVEEAILEARTLMEETLRLTEKKQQLDMINREIDELTLKITSLEQEIKANNQKNAQITAMISTHLERLEVLRGSQNA